MATPVLATTESPLPELLGEGALAISPSDRAGWLQAIGARSYGCGLAPAHEQSGAGCGEPAYRGRTRRTSCFRFSMRCSGMARPLRFCFLSIFYPPYSFGGDAIFVSRLANALAHRGHEVDVIHCVDSYKMLAPKRTASSHLPIIPT